MGWLSRQLKEAIGKRSLTVQGLSDRTGLSRSYLSLIIHGRRQPPEDVIRRLAIALGENPDDWAFHSLAEPQVEEIYQRFPQQFEKVFTRKVKR